MEEHTNLQLQALMQSDVQTACSIVEEYLQRIDQIDKHGPELNSVIELNPDALSIASALDEERRAGIFRGLLHGIPILIKDNIDTADRMTTLIRKTEALVHFASILGTNADGFKAFVLSSFQDL